MEYVSTGGKEPVVKTARAVTRIELYVDLDGSMTEEQLKRVFDQVCDVESVRICVDPATGEPLGYGYVYLRNARDVAKAMQALNLSFLNAKKIRIFSSNRGGNPGILFFKHLYKGLSKKAVENFFSEYGKVISCTLVLDSSGISKGCGYVKFDNEGSSRYAAEHLNGKELRGKKLYVDPDLQKLKFTNVCVSNISEWMTEKELKKIFSAFGPINNVLVARDANGISLCVGFVNFAKWEDASNSVEMLDGRSMIGRVWTVKRAHSRLQIVSINVRILIVRNMSHEIGDDKLKELFSPFGTIESCRIIRDRNGRGKGCGFVVFSTCEEAVEALQMHGKPIHSKSLYVEFARRKDEMSRLQAQVSEMMPRTVAPPRTLEQHPATIPPL